MALRSFSTTVIRPEDLLLINLAFRSVDFVAPQAGQPGRVTGLPGSLLVVHFQAQHIAEQAFYQASENVQQTAEEIAAGQPPPPGNETPTPPGTVQSLLAGPSRLVFTIPNGEVILYTLPDLLEALTRLPLSVTPVSSYEPVFGCTPAQFLLNLLRPTPPPAVAPPLQTHTAIEAPYRLFLSPDHQSQWAHASLPVTRNDWTELWHTRLGSTRRNGDPRVRAIWSPDFNANNLQPHYDPDDPPTLADPFRTSLDARDRNELVHLTSNYYLPSFTPTPVETERFMLTTLGVWLKVQGDWLPPSMPVEGSLTVERWRHNATMARDHYVRVVYAGYLFPFGHRASLVKVTERKFYYREDAEVPGFIAYLFQRMFIVVREPTRSYNYRETPFRTVTIKTRVTPNLADPTESDVNGHLQEAFWPRVVAGQAIEDFQFEVAATDWEGRTAAFATPLLFVSKNIDETSSSIEGIVNHYNGLGLTSARRAPSLGGQDVAFAPPEKVNDTTLETATVSLGAAHRPGETPHFRPTVARADVQVPALKQLLGTAGTSTVEWEPTFLEGSGQAIGNAGQVFLKLVGTTPLTFGSTEKSGGLVAPDLAISGLSRVLGPVGGPVEQMVGGNPSPAEFKPQEIFDTGVKLFGGIELGQIIKDLVFHDAASAGDKLPQLVTVRDGDVIRTTYTWQLEQNELVDTGLFVPQSGAQFKLQAVAEKKLDNSPPAFSVAGELTNFAVMLLPGVELVQISFQSVSFTAEGDKKVDVDVQMGEIQFLGILEFVNQLSSFIPLDGFSDPPSLELVASPPGLEVGFSFGIPTINIGVMTIQNVSLAAGVYLPFTDAEMNFHFAFCERQQPFILTVYLFGGGGFFAMDVGISGVTMIEAALEFGASVALDLGVASGKASIMAGFYFQKTGAEFILTGYFRAGGSLSVLGIITVSLEFYLGLTYASKGITPHGGTLWGQAKLTVKVEILFFSASVSISMEREFAGSDPTLREMLTAGQWTEYCDAFADYPPVIGG